MEDQKGVFIMQRSVLFQMGIQYISRSMYNMKLKSDLINIETRTMKQGKLKDSVFLLKRTDLAHL